MAKKKLVSILIPVKNEADNIEELERRVTETISKLNSAFEFEILINDNASVDNSVIKIKEWARRDSRVCPVFFNNDKGFQGSLLSGMRRARGEALIVLQSDLQDPPELIHDFLVAWAGGSKVVAGVISKRSEGLLNRLGRRIFYFFLDFATEGQVVKNFQDFYLLDKSVYEEISKNRISHAFLRVRISSEFGVDKSITYSRAARSRGKSKFGFSNKYQLALDAILSSGLRFTRILTLSALILTLSMFLALGILIFSKILGVDFNQRGWVSLMCVILFGFSLISTLLSFIIEYLVRILRIVSRVD